jgi:hypothetical protein
MDFILFPPKEIRHSRSSLDLVEQCGKMPEFSMEDRWTVEGSRELSGRH